jgi:hypothetical protein
MKRCCNIRLPFKRKRQQSFATSSSSEEKWRPCCCVTGRFRNNVAGAILLALSCYWSFLCFISGRDPHSRHLQCHGEGFINAKTGEGRFASPFTLTFPQTRELQRSVRRLCYQDCPLLNSPLGVLILLFAALFRGRFDRSAVTIPLLRRGVFLLTSALIALSKLWISIHR